MDEIKRDLQNPSKATHEDLFGKGITYICIGFVSLLVISILYFITTRGLATFTVNHVSLWKFLSGTTWNPSLLDKHGNPEIGALPMIVTSFSVTVLAAVVATPFALGVALFMTEIAPEKGLRSYNQLLNCWLESPPLFMDLLAFQSLFR